MKHGHEGRSPEEQLRRMERIKARKQKSERLAALKKGKPSRKGTITKTEILNLTIDLNTKDPVEVINAH